MLIGISGKKHSGKTTSAKFIKKYMSEKNKDFKIYNFADKLKEIVYDLTKGEDSLKETKVEHFYCFKIKNIENNIYIKKNFNNVEDAEKFIIDTKINFKHKIEKVHFSHREILQQTGEFFRSINENIWVNYLLDKYKEELKNKIEVNWIITDVRYLNEYNEIIKNNGKIIRLKYNNNNIDTHKSETELDFLDNIENNKNVYVIDSFYLNENFIKELDLTANKILKSYEI